jgi:tetratricopeptide (TPR) repeat protein
MLGTIATRRPTTLAVFLGALGVLAGCPKQPEFVMEEPGRPSVTWQNETGDAAPAPDEHAQRVAERELLSEIHDAERQGTDELALASAFYNLAILRRQQGEFADAGKLYRKALEIRERKEGPHHPDVATTLNNLAGLEAARGNYAAAQPMLERALTIRQTALGNEHVLTAQSMNNLALLYAAQGNAAAAEPLYQQAISALEIGDGSRRGELDRVLDNYAAMLHDTGRDAEADALEAQARRLRAAAAPEDSSPH